MDQGKKLKAKETSRRANEEVGEKYCGLCIYTVVNEPGPRVYIYMHCRPHCHRQAVQKMHEVQTQP